ncbi:MAG: N-acetylglucosaminyltransferase [Leptolyngbyaceae cyanobacterium RU_5_1]|nr:N-acetylglucosaminyltransferase [Leptolyngbyaceae cyanobacterium RU_5_1]
MPRIFVQIASYRDPELVATVEDALQKAANPENVSFGIVWQGKSGVDGLPLHQLDCCRIVLVDSDRSRGVCWARAKAQSLWDGEPYTLQIDSHMRFVHGWDELLLHMLHQCPSSKPLLTAYPPAYTPPNILQDGEPTTLGASHFTEQGILGLASRLSLRYQCKPQLGLFIAAGFWFAPAQLIEEVPYDPQLYFQGEEIALTVRAWTQGWDIYHPNQIVCYHEYERAGKPKHWEDHPTWWRLDQMAHARLRLLLGMEPGIWSDRDRYGLGTVRSLQSYEHFSSVNFQKQTFGEAARKGVPEGLAFSLRHSQYLQFTGDASRVMISSASSGLENK